MVLPRLKFDEILRQKIIFDLVMESSDLYDLIRWGRTSKGYYRMISHHHLLKQHLVTLSKVLFLKRFDVVSKNHLTDQICLEVIRRNLDLFKSLPKNRKTKQICLEAVKKNVGTFLDVPESMKTEEICYEAIKQNARMLGHMPIDQRNEKIYL